LEKRIPVVPHLRGTVADVDLANLTDVPWPHDASSNRTDLDRNHEPYPIASPHDPLRRLIDETGEQGVVRAATSDGVYAGIPDFLKSGVHSCAFVKCSWYDGFASGESDRIPELQEHLEIE
jgi:hypothetical protein